jgi:hypothetical protein
MPKKQRITEWLVTHLIVCLCVTAELRNCIRQSKVLWSKYEPGGPWQQCSGAVW